MRKVSDILGRKGKNVISVSPDTPVIDSLRIMAEKNIGSVAVIRNEEYLGLVTERDYARKVILKGKSSAELSVEDIMSTGLPRITPDNSIEVCMHLMSENNIRYLPVFGNDQLCGLISIHDVIRETIHHQQETIEELQQYIHS
jgi:CBS domain-containing protein